MQANDAGEKNDQDPSQAPKTRRSRRKQRYELQEEVGAGGMGVVYRAFDRELNRIVAVKVLRPEYASSLSGLLRLKRELVLASRVSDRHVVRVHDFGEVDGKALISMDWVDGESLASLLRRVHTLPPSQVYDFATQISKALQVIHAANIVHRDLKPGNLLISRNGELLVTDFGLAHADRPQDRSINEPGFACGTPRYMAPEQMAGLPANERSDLYSLGIVLLEMLTGTAALEALEPLRQHWLSADVSLHIRSEESRKLAMLDTVIRRCLRLDRNERYPSADAIVADLTRGDYERAPPQLETEPERRWKSPRRVAAVAALTVALAAVPVLHLFRHITETVGASKSDSPEQLYARALSTVTPASGESELRAAERDLNESLRKRPNYSPALQELEEVRIRLYEATADTTWLTRARAALESPAAVSLSKQQRTLFKARIDVNAGLFSQVVRDLQQNQVLLRSSADANRLLGRGLEGSGQLMAALPFYRTAVRLSPELWKGHNELGSALLAAGSLDEARAEFVRVTELQPAAAVGFSNLGLALLYGGDLAHARENFERALELQTSPSVYFNLGLTTYFSHQYASSIPFFESALRMHPDSDLYLSGLAAALWHSGRKEAARGAYLRALALLDELEPKQPLTTEQQCRRALYYARLGDAEMARATLDTVTRFWPEDQNVLYTGAVLAAAEGRRSAAKKMISGAVQHGFSLGLAKVDPDLEAVF